MVEHECQTCGKIFNKKCDFTRHINKQKICKKKLKPENNSLQIIQNNNVNILDNSQQLIQTINIDVLNNILNTLKSLSEDIEILKEKNEKLQEKVKESTEELKEKVKETNDELKESTQELKESNKKIKEKVKESNKKIKTLEKNNDKIIKKVSELHNPTNIKMINNITINIIAFGNEDLNFINNECVKKLLYKGFESIQNYVTMVHFNEEKPEYQNIYISNKRNKNEIMVNDGNKWNIAKTNDIIEKIFFRSITFFKYKIDDLKNELLANKIKGINRLISNYDEDENKLIKDISTDIVLEIYNNRDKPMSNIITKKIY
jgi:uncharacterized protein YoxC